LPVKTARVHCRCEPYCILDIASSRVTLESESTLFTKGGAVMANAVIWESEMNKALARGQAEKKPILLDFFNPG